jgi:2-C-methyl-D-erythritol 4-phosphate cytidylyltransferase / 2-C-methyl-D-erythritol 2,4-cyclodiphosphate synthase
VIGGETRQQSVRNGLEALAGDPPDLVLIHDAARPLIGQETLDALLEAMQSHDGAIVAVPVADTLKRAGSKGEIVETVPREQLWQAQTPQAFRYADILAAHRKLAGSNLTDDAALAEASGLSVALVEARSPNFKITRRNDLTMADALIAGNEGQSASTLPAFESRTGFGFDVHRLVPGNGVILCNVVIPSDMKLDGHSDADVALHAVTDALLSSICAGDIGQHFPPSDPKWKGADSAQFLEHAVAMLKERQGRIVHTDVTLMCEFPKIGPHRDKLQARLAEILGISVSRTSVKATTTERLGFTGRGEGIACQAVVTVELPRQPD